MVVKGFLFVILAIATCKADEFDERIINGSAHAIQYYPFQAQVFTTDRFCGAVILSEYFVVTAAQCTEGMDAGDLKVVVGSTFSQAGGITHDVATIHEHSKYQNHGEWKEYDVSVLRLKTRLVYTDTVKVAKLPHLKQVFSPGLQCTVLGWGSVGVGVEQELGRPLRMAHTKIVSHEECTALFKSRHRIKKSMICAWNGVAPGIKGPCYGDEGGALMCEGILAGIVSFGGDSEHCNAMDKPYVYTDISDPEILPFILKSMDQQNS